MNANRANEYFGPLTQTQASQMIGVDCIDDRGYAVRRQNVKVAAGPFGLAMDVMAAHAVMRSNARIDDEKPVGQIAKIIRRGLGVHALDACTHNECAAENGARPIAQFIADEANYDAVRHSTGELLDRDIDGEQFDIVREYYGNLATDQSVLRAPEREAECMDNEGVISPIDRHALAHEEHSSGTMIWNSMENTWFDAQQAKRDGYELYVVDGWAVPRFARGINSEIPIFNNEQDVAVLSLSMAIRHAAISHILPAEDGENSGVRPTHRTADGYIKVAG